MRNARERQHAAEQQESHARAQVRQLQAARAAAAPDRWMARATGIETVN
jgi:hypothetical protein